MKKKNEGLSLRETFAIHRRAAHDMRLIAPGYFAPFILYAIANAAFPYAVIWLSARLIDELSTLRRPEILGRWVLWIVTVSAADRCLHLPWPGTGRQGQFRLEYACGEGAIRQPSVQLLCFYAPRKKRRRHGPQNVPPERTGRALCQHGEHLRCRLSRSKSFPNHRRTKQGTGRCPVCSSLRYRVCIRMSEGHTLPLQNKFLLSIPFSTIYPSKSSFPYSLAFS